MNVEIGTEAAQFPEKEYINGISLAVRTVCSLTCSSIIGSQGTLSSQALWNGSVSSYCSHKKKQELWVLYIYGVQKWWPEIYYEWVWLYSGLGKDVPCLWRVLLNFYRAQESIPRNRFRQPIPTRFLAPIVQKVQHSFLAVQLIHLDIFQRLIFVWRNEGKNGQLKYLVRSKLQ